MSTENDTPQSETPQQTSSGGMATKLVVFLAVASASLFAYFNYGVALLIYVLVTGVSLPGASILTLAYAWYFGFARGLVLVSFASTGGATMAFLLSRYFLRDSIQSRFGDRLALVNESLEREGAFYLFTLRLITAVPFFVINPVMGLTPVRVWTYWWVSQLGMLPGTVVYVYAGSQFPDLKTLAEDGGSGLLTWPLGIAFAMLGLFPFVVKKLVAKWKAGKVAEPAASSASPDIEDAADA
jgi:uncharacterized membrane protein YdjX (TVP38/TMEM64 family)